MSQITWKPSEPQITIFSTVYLQTLAKPRNQMHISMKMLFFLNRQKLVLMNTRHHWDGTHLCGLTVITCGNNLYFYPRTWVCQLKPKILTLTFDLGSCYRCTDRGTAGQTMGQTDYYRATAIWRGPNKWIHRKYSLLQR